MNSNETNAYSKHSIIKLGSSRTERNEGFPETILIGGQLKEVLKLVEPPGFLRSWQREDQDSCRRVLPEIFSSFIR